MNLSPKVQITKSGVTAEDVAEITGRNPDRQPVKGYQLH